jgi:lipoprotein LprG
MRTFLVHTEHQHLAANRADLPGRKVDHRDDRASDELLRAVVIGQTPRGRPGPKRTEVDKHSICGTARFWKRLAAHHRAHPDVDPEELCRVDFGQHGAFLTGHMFQCIGRPILARHLNALEGHVIAGLRRFAIIATTSLLMLSGCGTPAINATDLLHRTKAVLDSTPSFHFTLSGANVTGSGPLLTGGRGDMRRPTSMSGTLQVSIFGLAIGVPVVSVRGAFWVRLPTNSGFTAANPASYGFADPARLIDPDHGLSSLLLTCRSPQVESDDRYNGEALHEIGCTLPGSAVAALLTSADPSKDVAATFGIDTTTSQLRRVVLSGPFVTVGTKSTYTLILANYGENVAITPPPAIG